ncbi:MAG: hypothetical protein ABI333_07155 [bacterium]
MSDDNPKELSEDLPAGQGRESPFFQRRRLEREDGYKEDFHDSIAEAAFLIQQGLLEDGINALEELRAVHGDDPRVMGRLHVAKMKLRKAQDAAAGDAPVVTPPVAGKRPSAPKPRPAPPKMPAVEAKPPDVEPEPLPPIPIFLEESSPPGGEDDFEQRKTDPLPSMVSGRPVTAPAVGRDPVRPAPATDVGAAEAESLFAELDAELSEAEPPHASVTPGSTAPPSPAQTSPSPTAPALPHRPFEPKRAVMTPPQAERPAGLGRGRLLLLVVGMFALVFIVVLIVVSGRKGGAPAKSPDKPTVARAPVKSAPSRRPAAPPPVPRTIGSGPRVGRSAEPPAMTAEGGVARVAAASGMEEDPKTPPASKPHVRLRLEIKPEKAASVVIFRGREYWGATFESPGLEPAEKPEVVKIKAKGYRDHELMILLNRDVERLIKLKKRPKRMKLFDIGKTRPRRAQGE